MVTHHPKHKPLPVAPENRPLTAMQRRVLEHVLQTGDTVTETAKALSIPRNSVSRIVHLPQVEKEMAEGIRSRLLRGSAQAMIQLDALSRSAKSEYVRLQASDSILDRGGFKPPDRLHAQVQNDVRFVIDLG